MRAILLLLSVSGCSVVGATANVATTAAGAAVDVTTTAVDVITKNPR